MLNYGLDVPIEQKLLIDFSGESYTKLAGRKFSQVLEVFHICVRYSQIQYGVALFLHVITS